MGVIQEIILGLGDFGGFYMMTFISINSVVFLLIMRQGFQEPLGSGFHGSSD